MTLYLIKLQAFWGMTFSYFKLTCDMTSYPEELGLHVSVIEQQIQHKNVSDFKILISKDLWKWT
jgi:hypothetical protein